MPAERQIKIKHFINPSLFTYKYVDSETKSNLTQLESDLEKYVLIFNEKIKFTPVVNQIVLALNPVTEKWYRLKVMLIEETDERVYELYGLAIDYGKLGIVECQNAIPLLDQALLSLDIGTYYIGGLSDVVPASYVSEFLFHNC